MSFVIWEINGMSDFRKGNSNDLAALLVELVNKRKDLMTNIKEIKNVAQQTHILSINSSIEAARVGAAGAGFSVIAREIQELANKSSNANAHSEHQMNELLLMINDMAGVRTADIAYDLIDKIDRNLFERNCDVQAWATFDLIVDSLTDPSTTNQNAVNKLLKNICDLYEVYYDVFLANSDGVLVGAANRNNLLGNDVTKREWFASVLKGRTNTVSDMYFDENIGDYTVAYSAPVVAPNGELLGVISTRFNWNFIYDIIEKAKVSEKGSVYLVNIQGQVIASLQREDVFKKDLRDTPVLNNVIKGEPYGYMIKESSSGQPKTIYGYAHTQGYNAYKGKDWSVIVKEDF